MNTFTLPELSAQWWAVGALALAAVQVLNERRLRRHRAEIRRLHDLLSERAEATASEEVLRRDREILQTMRGTLVAADAGTDLEALYARLLGLCERLSHERHQPLRLNLFRFNNLRQMQNYSRSREDLDELRNRIEGFIRGPDHAPGGAEHRHSA